MVSKNGLKDLVIAFGRKCSFFNFKKKITWFYIAFAGIVFFAPTAFKENFYNWLVATFDLNIATYAEVEASNAEYVLVFAIVVKALFYNILEKKQESRKDVV